MNNEQIFENIVKEYSKGIPLKYLQKNDNIETSDAYLEWIEKKRKGLNDIQTNLNNQIDNINENLLNI